MINRRVLIKFHYTDRKRKEDYFFAIAESNKEKALSVFYREYDKDKVEIKQISFY
jgi:hypothetical protein